MFQLWESAYNQTYAKQLLHTVAGRDNRGRRRPARVCHVAVQITRHNAY